jgi:uncharacterized protein (DUF362 family)
MMTNDRASSSVTSSVVALRSVGEQAVRDAVAECMNACDWETLVPSNAHVIVKPNLCTAVPDKVAASNTAPEITAAVCEILLTRTAHVTLAESDGLRQTAWQAFEASGYVPMARRLGVKLMNLTEEQWVPQTLEPAGVIELPRPLLETDVFITLPVLKTHALTYFTGALKNQWGCLPQYDRILYHRYLDPLLASLHRLLRPRFALMDGILGMEGRGPANGKPRRMDLILASRDSVALDASAMRLVGLDPTRARHVVLAARDHLGSMEEAAITLDGDWQAHATHFEPAILDKAIAAMDYMSRYRWFVKYMLERDSVFYPVRAFVQVLRRIGVVEGA